MGCPAGRPACSWGGSRCAWAWRCSRWWSACGQRTRDACRSEGNRTARVRAATDSPSGRGRERVLHPDTASGEMESRESAAEVQSFRVRMEHIRRAAFLHMVGCSLESREEELIELLVLHGAVLDSQIARALEGNAVGRVCQQKVGALAVHQLRHSSSEVASPQTSRCRPTVHTSPDSTKEAFSRAAVRSKSSSFTSLSSAKRSASSSSLKPVEERVEIGSLQG